MKLILAGAEHPKKLDILISMGATNILMSYYYMRKHADRGEAVIKRAKEAGMWIIVDSGAFTYKEKYCYLRRDWIKDAKEDGVLRPDMDLAYNVTQQRLDDARHEAGNTSREELIDELEDYWQGYYKWLQRMSGHFDAFAELDMDMFVDDRIWTWRQQIRDAMDSGRIEAEPVITPHWFSSLEHYKRIAEDYGFQYLGIEGGKTAEWYQSFFATHMPILRKHRIRTHGWGTTNNFSVSQIPFFSVDSTTWMMGEQYGTTYIYDGQLRISTHGHEYKERRGNWRDRCEKFGLNFESFLREDGETLNRFNAANWIEYQKDMESYTANSYWLTDGEKGEIIEKARQEAGIPSVPILRDSLPVEAKDMLRNRATRFCNTCYLNTKCMFFEANAACKVEESVKVDGISDIMGISRFLIATQTERVAHGAFAEKVMGTPLDDKVSKEISRTQELLEGHKRLQEQRQRVDISMVATSTSTAGQEGARPSLFDRLAAMNGGGALPPAKPSTVELEAEIVETVPASKVSR
jgi:hypothetical protein